MITQQKKLIIISLFLILFFPSVHSISLGTLPKNDYVEIRQGETGIFTILFWNGGDTSYRVSLVLGQVSDNLFVIIRPDNFILNPAKLETPPYNKDAEYLNIPHLGGVVKVESIEILAKVSESAELGEHTVTIFATAGNPGNDISVLQERMFNLRVNVTRSPTLFEEIAKPLRLIGKKLTEQGEDIGKGITGAFSGVSINLRIVFFTTLILITIAVPLIIYKKYKK